MKLSEARTIFREMEEKTHALGHGMGMITYDAVTGAPSGAAAGRGRTLGVLSEMVYLMQTDPKVQEAAELLRQSGETELERREAELFLRDSEYMKAIPQQEYVDYTVLLNDADAVWHRAKAENDFAAFAPDLEKIFDCNRRFALYYRPEEKPYDTLLSQYERGLTMEQLDGFFGPLRARIVPLLQKIAGTQQVDDSCLHGYFPAAAQRAFSDDLMAEMGIDRALCGIAETEHPFTTNFNTKDVRITTHYYEDHVDFSMFSVIHEGGHALYEMGVDEAYDFTELAGGVSMGIHESQSRFYENLIGRSRPFMDRLLPLLQKHFPSFAGITPEQLYRAVNKSQPSLIRTEADELTYPLHIMVRYELEKALIAGELKVAELPGAWNEMVGKYLGIPVPTDREGVLQDSHWSGGSVGYFPSYALGSAYGAQLLAKMRESVDVDAAIAAGQIGQVTAWLREHIFRHGRRYDPAELLERACGAPFDASYYIEYLEKKYSGIYGV